MKEVESGAYKRIPLEILIEFANYCENNSLNYSLAYGTLLGAVRHKGYIPWDDDIDVFMPRKDYEVFRETYISEKYELKDLRNDKHYPVGVAKLCDKKTEYYYLKTAKRNFGLFIDIFVLDKAPVDLKERQRWLKQTKNLQNWNRLINTNYSHYFYHANVKMKIKALLAKCMYPFSIQIHTKLEKLYRMYNDCDGNIFCSPSDIRKGMKTFCYPDYYFQQYEKMEFENHLFNVTAYYKEVLTTIYGDYMKLPPEEERVPKHDMVAYYK